MALFRVVVSGLVIVFCAGFIPVGGCAKGCGKLAGRSGDDIARTGGRFGDDIAISSSRYGRYGGSYGDDLARSGRYRTGAVVVPGPGVGGMGDDLAHLSRNSLDESIIALPEAEGPINALARKPTSGGTVLDDLDDPGRTFGKDYAKSVDDIGVNKKQHDELMEAFETAQDIGGEVIDALAEDDEPDAPEKQYLAAQARQKLQLSALMLEAELAETLTPEQLAKFRTQFGSSETVVYRLAKEKPVVKRAKASDKRAKQDKVAP